MVASGSDLLERLDRIVAELLELRAEVAGVSVSEPTTSDWSGNTYDDLAPEHLLDTSSASSRFGFPQDTLRKWARTEGLGIRRGGRWLVSVPRLRQRLNGKP